MGLEKMWLIYSTSTGTVKQVWHRDLRKKRVSLPQGCAILETINDPRFKNTSLKVSKGRVVHAFLNNGSFRRS